MRKGLEFAEKKNLTPKEIKLLNVFWEKDLCLAEISEITGDKINALHPKILQLRLKGAIRIKDKLRGGHHVYGISEEGLK